MLLSDKLYLAGTAAVVPGLGLVHIKEAVDRLGSSEKLFTASRQELMDLGIFSGEAVENFLRGREKVDPQVLGQKCNDLGIQIISYYEDAYPASLREIHSPPMVLYVMGNMPPDGYHIGIVGSRLATSYGLKAARYFASSMVAGDVAVISGGAAGIDAAAHGAVLEKGGITVAVLGCGTDIAFPQENKNLFAGILKRGALVSEYPPGTPPLGRHFPARNRIIVGLSRGIIVCEAAKRSGALITARLGVEEHREVYCVPGSIFEPTSMGCHDMIMQGAKILCDAREIFLDREEFYDKLSRGRNSRELNLFREPQVIKPTVKKQNNPALEQLTPRQKQLYELLGQGSMTLDSIMESSGLDFAALSMELLDMQVLGLVDQDQAQRYYRL